MTLTKTLVTYITNANAAGTDQSIIDRTVGEIIAAFNK